MIFSSINRSASIEITATAVTFCWLSIDPIARISFTSHIKQRLILSENHTVCALKGHGLAPCVKLMLLILRSPDDPSKGSNSIISLRIDQFHLWQGRLLVLATRTLLLKVTRILFRKAQEFLSPDITQIIHPESKHCYPRLCKYLV